MTALRKDFILNYRDYIADPMRKCAVVAHRGAWHHAPENSRQALEAAIAQGYAIVEIDVRESADGELFLLHDDTLARMADHAQRPETLTLAELQAITLREGDGGHDAAMTECTIPSLADIFETARDRIFLDLDLKDPSLFAKVTATAHAHGVERQVDIKASVADEGQLQAVKRLHAGSDLPFMAMVRFDGDGDAQTTERVIASGAFMCEAKFADLDLLAAQAPRLAKAGIPLWVNTLDPVCSAGMSDSAALDDPDAIWGTLIAAGVRAIQTDQPAALKTYLERAAG